MTSCCSSGWGQSVRGGCCKGREGEVTRVIVAAAAGMEPKQWRRIARLFPDHFLLCLREVRALARPLRDFGALARTRRHNFSCDFCNCVRARWRWVSLGRGGRGTSTAAAAHVTGCIPVGLTSNSILLPQPPNPEEMLTEPKKMTLTWGQDCLFFVLECGSLVVWKTSGFFKFLCVPFKCLWVLCIFQ
uniref:Uncharacterized protein n=1 Tax=Castor canadensis TaxID=51338 RepID=A0A8C0XES0_CASCN